MILPLSLTVHIDGILEMFDQPGVFYFNQPDTIYDKATWSIDPKKLEHLKNYKLVVADFSSEHYGQDTLYSLYDTLESEKINFLLLSHSPADHLTLPRLLFYPHWYHESRKSLFNISKLNTIEKTYKLSCLNGVPRFHRIYNWLILKEKSYANDLLLSMHRRPDYLLDNPRSDDHGLSADIVAKWNLIQSTLTEKQFSITKGGRDLGHSAYSDSYINLVTETTVIDKVFVTEKTWKPVASGQLFLILGNPGTLDYLRSQGIDTFDDIIDHKYYDNEQNWQQRIQKIHQVIEDLIQQNLYKINQSTWERRKRNSEQFFAGAFDQQYQNQIQECINTLK